MNDIDTITMLNRLIVTAKNSESSLRAAAEEAYHDTLKQSLSAYSQFFGDAAHEMQQAVHKLGGRPAEIGTFGNTLHRTLMHLKVTAMGRREDVILDEVESDEVKAEQQLAEAVKEDMPPQIHELLERHYWSAQHHHGTIRELRAQMH